MLQSLNAETRLAMSLPEAAKRLGMATYTLRRRIKAKEIRAVRIGPRSYIPFTEIDRLMNPPTENGELSSGPANGNSENGPGCLKSRRGDAEKTQNERLTPEERMEAVAALWGNLEMSAEDRQSAIERMGATPEERLDGLLYAAFLCAP